MCTTTLTVVVVVLLLLVLLLTGALAETLLAQDMGTVPAEYVARVAALRAVLRPNVQRNQLVELL